MVWTIQPDYRIAFPGTPGPTEHITEATKYGNSKVTVTTLTRPSGAFYVFQITEMPIGTVTSDGTIDAFLKILSEKIGENVTIASEGRATVGVCNAQSITATAPMLTVRSLFCGSRSRSYWARVTILNPAASGDVSEASAFLESFWVGQLHDGG
jgi:phosphoribosylformylglycinamidine (FGAM) synthase-like amidotransferase family enzyme